MYFYPFCLINSIIATWFICNKCSYFTRVMACTGMAEYMYFFFAFPVESWHFHKRALSKDKQYA